MGKKVGWRCNYCLEAYRYGWQETIGTKPKVVCSHCKSDSWVEMEVGDTVAPSRSDLKWDSGKIKPTLIIPEFLQDMAAVLTQGETNHPKVQGVPSWQHLESQDFQDALYRHFFAVLDDPTSHNEDMFAGGENCLYPEPTPCSHYTNIAVNAMFLWWLEKQKEQV